MRQHGSDNLRLVIWLGIVLFGTYTIATSHCSTTSAGHADEDAAVDSSGE